MLHSVHNVGGIRPVAVEWKRRLEKLGIRLLIAW